MKTGELIMVAGYLAVVLAIMAGFRRVERAINDLPDDLLKTILR